MIKCSKNKNTFNTFRPEFALNLKRLLQSVKWLILNKFTKKSSVSNEHTRKLKSKYLNNLFS